MNNFPQGTLPRLIQVALAEVGTAETGQWTCDNAGHFTPMVTVDEAETI